MVKLISWNVNGIRACVKKGFLDFFKNSDADIFCIQESKLQAGQIELDLPGYHQYWNYAQRKGYSGTAVFTKTEPLHVSYGFVEGEVEEEGRLITCEFESFYLVTMYTPNSKRDLSRIVDRLRWEDKVRDYINKLDEHKPVVLCGDLNVAHQPIDLKNDRSNRGNSGFTDEEREKMTQLLDAGFIDTFRYLHPDRDDAYTWWSYMNKVRERNIGWRIDYVIASQSLAPALASAGMEPAVLGSDHCPVYAEFIGLSE
ncbi:apurinic/apyrimidinic endonuclease [Bacillus sp. 349Y]|jgi:exodeoxyribonuclease III|nr:apurinic/apyrimidinic endonuclease [Bacillus sp. 349Y]